MRLNQLLDQIAEYENCAFNRHFGNLATRKKAMIFAARSCDDDNLKNILGGAVGYFSNHPEWVRGAISKARDHIETLRFNGH